MLVKHIVFIMDASLNKLMYCLGNKLAAQLFLKLL